MSRSSNYSVHRGPITVYINIYDLHKNNQYLHWCGLGAYHSGVEIFGKEYTFGQHGDYNITGVFNHEPRCASGAVFREQIIAGVTQLNVLEIERELDELRQRFLGTEYNMIRRNCNHFANALCESLGVYYPSWINRLSSVARTISCCLPDWVENSHSPVSINNTNNASVVPVYSNNYKNNNINNNSSRKTDKSFNSTGYSLVENKDDDSNNNTNSFPWKTKLSSTPNAPKELYKQEQMRSARLANLSPNKSNNSSSNNNNKSKHNEYEELKDDTRI